MKRNDENCKTCGFPKNMKRVPVFMDDNILCYVNYLDNQCEECGHQKDGSTIKSVYDFWQKMVNEIIKAKDEEFKKTLKLPNNLIAKDKDDWEFEQFRIRQQTAKEIFAEIEEKYKSEYWDESFKKPLKRFNIILTGEQWQDLKKKFEVRSE